jgi:hypothetical protein
MPGTSDSCGAHADMRLVDLLILRLYGTEYTVAVQAYSYTILTAVTDTMVGSLG